MSCSSESYPATKQPTTRPASDPVNPAMDLQFVTPAMSQQTFPWSSPDPFGMRTAPSAPQAPAASSSSRRTSSRTSSRSPTNDDTGNGFRFVTATRPEEFRNPELMRTVRSHVMFGVVEGRQRPKKATPSTRAESSTGAGAPPAATIAKRPMQTLRRSDSLATASHPDNPPFMPREEALDIFQRYRVPRSSASLPGSTPRSDQGTDVDSPESYRPAYQPKRTKRNAMGTSTSASAHGQQLSDQVLVQPPEGGMYRINPLYDSAFQVLGPFKAFATPAPVNPFSSHDPFLALPQPISTEINMPLLKYYCHLYFGTRGMARAWLPQMIQSPESFLSTLAIATSHQDAMDGKLAPTSLTLTVQTEVFHLLNEAFNERWTRIKDTTIMSVVQLLCSELVNASGPERLVAHEQGLRRLIEERGGLNRLGLQGELAAVATAMAYSSSIFREGNPDPLFAEFANSLRTPVYGDKAVVPESPLFCPRARFFTLERSRRCTQLTLELVAKLKELVDLVSGPLAQSNWDLDQYKRGILAHVKGLPPIEKLPESAAASELERKARWRYEACRLAGILYAESLVNKKPLSTLPAGSANAPADAVSLEQLAEAIKRSDCPHSECWGDMTGVLYWVTLVGGAAAASDPRQRRWLTALNVRCAIVLAFEHRSAVVVSLRKMQRGIVRRG